MVRSHRGTPAACVASVVAVVAVVAVVLSACTPPTGRQEPWEGRYVRVPAVPFPVAATFAVDRELLDGLACLACGLPARPDDARFFYGTLALDSVDALFDPAGDGMDAPGDPVGSWLGNLNLSGWFGGRYLTTTVAIGLGEEGAATGAALPLSGAEVLAALLGALRGGTFAGLDASVGGLVRLADRGDEASVRRSAAGLVLLMSLVHGYNRGYLEVVLEHPPEGAAAPPPLQCGPWLGCRAPGLPLQALDALAPSAARLDSSEEPTWQLLGESLRRVGTAGVPSGRAVWSEVLRTDGFDPLAYESIVELSYGFLEVTEAAMLALAEGVAGDVEVGRRGLLLAAGMLLWSGSYLLGLTGGDGSPELPALRCG